MNDKVLTVEDIIKVIPVHKRTVQRYFREGTLKGTKVFGKWMIKKTDFDQYFLSPSNIAESEIVTK